MMLVAAAWGADREGRFSLGIWGRVERGEKGGVGVERWSEVGVGSTKSEDRPASGLPPHLL